MSWMKSCRWPVALTPAFVVWAGCAHEGAPGPATSATVSAALTEEPEPDQPVRPEESAAREQFRAGLSDTRPELEAAPGTEKQASDALEGLFSALDPSFKQRGMDASAKVTCLRNGCFKDVYFPDRQTLRAVTETLIPRPGPGRARGMSRYSLAHTGRTPQGSGFVVTWAILFPGKQP